MISLAKRLLACWLVFIFSIVANAQPYSPDETAILVNNIIKPTLQRNRVPGAALVLYNHGVPQAFYFGTATHSSYNKVNASTVFEVGSVTKIFTSLLLGDEANLGQLDLDDPAVMYLHNAPVNNRFFDQITLV
ncbi:MAG: serine hydrolase, partial [Gammaproteobacteria bacterium]|nr:serine hydrolase [Gammaproteobacteria bacterium]